MPCSTRMTATWSIPTWFLRAISNGLLLAFETMPSHAPQMALLAVGGARYNFRGFGDIRSALRGVGMFDPSSPPSWSPIPQSLTEVADVAAFPARERAGSHRGYATEAAVKRCLFSTFECCTSRFIRLLTTSSPTALALGPFSQINDGGG